MMYADVFNPMFSIKGLISVAPSAQFKPRHRGLAWETLTTNASPVCPDSVRPLLSTIVPDTWKITNNEYCKMS